MGVRRDVLDKTCRGGDHAHAARGRLAPTRGSVRRVCPPSRCGCICSWRVRWLWSIISKPPKEGVRPAPAGRDLRHRAALLRGHLALGVAFDHAVDGAPELGRAGSRHLQRDVLVHPCVALTEGGMPHVLDEGEGASRGATVKKPIWVSCAVERCPVIITAPQLHLYIAVSVILVHACGDSVVGRNSYEVCPGAVLVEVLVDGDGRWPMLSAELTCFLEELAGVDVPISADLDGQRGAVIGDQRPDELRGMADRCRGRHRCVRRNGRGERAPDVRTAR